MKRTFVVGLVLALAAAACTNQEPAETDSLSVPEATVGDAGSTATSSAASTTTDVDSTLTVSVSSPTVEAGDEVGLSVIGGSDDVTWTGPGTFDGSGASVTYTPPPSLGDYVVTATAAEHSTSAIVTVDTVTVYASDFSASPGAEWNPNEQAISPSGESFLGELGEDRARLTIQGLPTHDEISIAFDLYVLRSWDGLAERDQWALDINDDTLLYTTFSNDEKRQAYPESFPYGDNPGGSGATAINSLGYWYESEDNLADSTYRIERRVLHEGPLAYFDFQAWNLQGIGDESWGIDNVTVKVHRSAAGSTRPEAQLRFQIEGDQMSITGAVPDVNIESIIRNAAADWFGGWTLSVDLTPVSGAIAPRWLSDVPGIMHDLRNARDLSLTLGLREASLEGTVLTDRWRADLVTDVQNELGVTTLVIDRLDNAVSPDDVSLLDDLAILFDTGSADLGPESEELLAPLVALLQAHPELVVTVIGHTDLTGRADENVDLSWSRADAVRAHIVGRGVSEEQILTHGAADSSPVVEGNSPEANTANRRASFWVNDG